MFVLKQARWSLFAVSLCLCTAVHARGAPEAISSSAPDAIVIGQSAPLSGKNAALGQDIRRGAMAYFNQVNDRGGVGGKPIRLVTLDDRNEAAQAAVNTKALIEDHRAVVLYGYASATLSLPALPLAKARSMSLFAPFTGADVIHQSQDNVFTVRGSYRDELASIMRIWTPYLSRYAVVHYDDLVGKQNLETVQSELDGRSASVKSLAIKRNQPLPADIIQRILAAKPQLIIFTTLSDPIVEIVKLLKKTNEFFQFASLSLAGNNVLRDQLGKDGAGMIVASVVPLYDAGLLPVQQEYEQAMAKAGYPMSFTSLESFIAAKTLVAAMRRSTGPLTPASITANIEQLGDYDAGGYKLRFGKGVRHASRFAESHIISASGRFK
jgi:ABC-type branched-subunit amino acid transport system substrate-binding protein